MIKTKMTELLGVEYPIIMGPMAWITDAELVSAVSNAGGAGILAAGGRSPEWIHSEIARTRTMTDKPFGINISLATNPQFDDQLQAIIDEHPPFVTLGAGDPRPIIPKLKEAGIIAVSIVPNTKLALRIQEAGADMLIIEGMESGGRIGNLTTMALMTDVLPVINIPILVAGGIVDGRGLAAALLMGADGVQMGSRFLLAEECNSNPANAQTIIAAHDNQSVTIGLSRNHGLRGIKNAFTEGYRKQEIAGVDDAVLSEYTKDCSRLVAEKGVGEDEMNGLVQVGQSLDRLTKIQSAAQIIEELMTQAEETLRSAPSLLS